MAYKITQKPSPNFWNGRKYPPIIALVHHRMVGYLPGTDTTFLNADNQVSAHFGIGYRVSGGPVEISQYVDLSDTAWTAGNYDSSGGWPLVKRTSTGTVANPNYYIIGIEHEDGGPNDGRVSEAVLKASLWLDYILLSGSPDLIRFVGIKMRDDSIATQLKSIVPGAETLIDHNRISGKLKPYCWRPYKLDTAGFPGWQPKLLDYIRSASMSIQDVLDLLDQEVNKLVDETNQAVADKVVAETKLNNAKTIATEIKNIANDIVSKAASIENM